MPLFAGIEAGKGKFTCAVGDSSGKVIEKTKIVTTYPEETLSQVISFLHTIHDQTPLSALGIASFGFVDPDPSSPFYGYVTHTPISGWGQFDFLGTMKKALNLPIGFDTDVNGAALGEYRWGEARGLHTFVYINVGTGIAVGCMVEGKLVHGLMHPEIGHMVVSHDQKRDPFESVCPFHDNCLEGLASGPAMKRRWNVKSALDLPADHEAWDLEAEYLAQAIVNCILFLSPQKIIIGGGVMRREELLYKIRPKVQERLNGFIKHESILKEIDHYIVLPALGEDAGVCGAMALGEQSYLNSLLEQT